MNNLTAVIYPGYTAIMDSRSQGLIAGGGTKKAVSGFSKQSRLRLMKLIRSLSVPPDFHVTLSYPSFYPADSETWKRHLDNFRRAVVRAFPEFWAIWKLEPQKRGAPHFHLMCSLGAEVREKMKKADVYKVLRSIWYEVVGSGDWKHFLKGAQVQDLRGAGQAKRAMYLADYVFKVENGKDLPGWARPGRFWGVLNRASFPPCEWQTVDLELGRAVWLKRLVKRWLKRQSRQYSRRLNSMYSYSVFCDPELIRKALYWILGQSYQLQRWRSDRDYANLYFYDPKKECLDGAPF
jgi:hypothetical protein